MSGRGIRFVALLLAATATGAGAHEGDHLPEVAAFFAAADIVAGPDPVACTLSGGTETTCFSISVKADPQSYTPGPWCPTNVADGPEAGGIWMRDGEVHDVDGAFIENLAAFYGDAEWQLFDPDTGAIRYTGTLEACEAAARPDVDPAYRNHCVQCLPEYLPEDATTTYVIPLEPQPSNRSQPTNMTGSGLAHNGIRLDGPAPLDAILAAHTIAPFDDCGGHVNPHVGYHYHAVTDCLDGAGTTDVTLGAPIGIAMDGHMIYPHALADGSAPEDLDVCNGHAVDGTYVYHAGAPGSNAILGCLTAQVGCVQGDPDGTCDASVRPARPPRP